jgi:hypothetical protein
MQIETLLRNFSALEKINFFFLAISRKNFPLEFKVFFFHTLINKVSAVIYSKKQFLAPLKEFFFNMSSLFKNFHVVYCPVSSFFFLKDLILKGEILVFMNFLESNITLADLEMLRGKKYHLYILFEVKENNIGNLITNPKYEWFFREGFFPLVMNACEGKIPPTSLPSDERFKEEFFRRLGLIPRENAFRLRQTDL